jgi:hypothetical protein
MTSVSMIGSLPAGATIASTTAGRTRVVVADPATRTGIAAGFHVVRTDRIKGTIDCTGASETALGDVYRCYDPTAGVQDPCWLDPADSSRHTAVCPTAPWSHDLIRERVEHRLAHLKPRKIDRKIEPWGLQLANGRRAVLFEGAHDTYHGRPVDYTIGYRKNGHYHYLGGVLRGLHRGTQRWIADVVTYHRKSNSYTYAGRMAIVRVWYVDTHAPTT